MTTWKQKITQRNNILNTIVDLIQNQANNDIIDSIPY